MLKYAASLPILTFLLAASALGLHGCKGAKQADPLPVGSPCTHQDWTVKLVSVRNTGSTLEDGHDSYVAPDGTYGVLLELQINTMGKNPMKLDSVKLMSSGTKPPIALQTPTELRAEGDSYAVGLGVESQTGRAQLVRTDYVKRTSNYTFAYAVPKGDQLKAWQFGPCLYGLQGATTAQ
jgi:hypothetical protein